MQGYSPNKGVFLLGALKILLVPPVGVGGGQQPALAVVLLAPGKVAGAGTHPVRLLSVRTFTVREAEQS